MKNCPHSQLFLPVAPGKAYRFFTRLPLEIFLVTAFAWVLIGCTTPQEANSNPLSPEKNQAAPRPANTQPPGTTQQSLPTTAAGNDTIQLSATTGDPNSVESHRQPAKVASQTGQKTSGTQTISSMETGLAAIEPSWMPLVKRLQQDLPDVSVENYFIGLPGHTGKTMAKKIQELHHYNFVVKPRKPVDGDKKTIPEYEKSGVYKQFVTQAGMEKCSVFLSEYQQAFDLAEERFNVPREVIVSLLYVETQLGSYLGKAQPFWNLASMAASTTPEMIENDLKVTILPEQAEWLQEKLDEKSEWAYREVKALLTHCIDNGMNPQELLGSEYGAIGICQFMPTNLIVYTDDGDGDGIIDLFNPNDAILSAAKFLAVHHWGKADDIAGQRKVIMRYNISSRYANTVLALAESLETGSLKTAQADAPSRVTPKKQSPPKGTSAQNKPDKGGKIQQPKKPAMATAGA